MAPTVCMAEVGERLGYLDTSLDLSYRLSEKRRSLRSRKRLYRNLRPCQKLQMGLVMEECHQPPPCEPPYLDSDGSDSDQSLRSRDRYSMVTITLRTLALLRRNQQLQQRLSLLQQETRAFVNTALASRDCATVNN